MQGSFSPLAYEVTSETLSHENGQNEKPLIRLSFGQRPLYREN